MLLQTLPVHRLRFLGLNLVTCLRLVHSLDMQGKVCRLLEIDRHAGLRRLTLFCYALISLLYYGWLAWATSSRANRQARASIIL